MDTFVSNENYEDEKEDSNVVAMTSMESKNDAADVTAKKRKLKAFWKVGDESYRLKLSPPEIQELEKMYKCNLMSLMGDADRLPPLTTMLQVTHAAMKKWKHGLKLKDVQNLYEQYIESGGSMFQFYVDVYMQIYAVSGFFSSTMAEELTDTMEEMSNIL